MPWLRVVFIKEGDPSHEVLVVSSGRGHAASCSCLALQHVCHFFYLCFGQNCDKRKNMYIEARGRPESAAAGAEKCHFYSATV